MVDIYAIKLIDQKDFEEVRPYLQNLLPDNVIERLGKFRNPPALQRNLLGEILSRSLLAQTIDIPLQTIKIHRSEKGKPYYTDYPEWHFNISHSGEWVITAFSDDEVGVDIEQVKNINLQLARRFFSQEENERLNQFDDDEKIDFFFDLWTLKESYLKFLGRGLTKALKSFTILDSNGKFYLKNDLDDHRRVYFKQFHLDPDCKLSVCSGSPQFNKNIMYIPVNELLKRLQD